MSQISTYLSNLKATYDAIDAFAKTLTQRQCLAGVIAYKQGKTYTPTAADTWFLVNDDPNHPATSEMGAKADSLHYAIATNMGHIWQAQRALGVPTNTGAEIFQAAMSGDYSGIRGA